MIKSFNSFFDTAIFFLLILFSLVLAFGQNFSVIVLDGINLWVACVLPSLFPYFFITAVLSKLKMTSKISNGLSPLTKRFFNVGGAVGYAFFISLLSGYPTGAKMVSDLKEKGLISDEESIRASAVCSTSSPMFLIGSVGNLMFGSSLFGVLLFCCHLLSALTIGFIFSFYKKGQALSKNATFISEEQTDNILYESVFSAVTSVLVVGGLIVIFYLLTEVMFRIGLLSPLINGLGVLFGNQTTAKGIVFGALECTSGLKSLCSLGITSLSLPLCAFTCGFGGLSVIIQSVAYLKKAKIKTAPFIFSKLLSAVVNFIYALIASFIFL